MVEESSPQLPPAEESIEAETDSALEPQPESGEPTAEPASEPVFVCDCEESMRSACEGLPSYKEHESRRYCVLHYPGKEKLAVFEQVLHRKLANDDFDFSGVWWPGELLEFWNRQLPDSASFLGCTFSCEANFSDAKFSGAVNFSKARFCGKAIFTSAIFSGDANFSETAFKAESDFSSATFKVDARFLRATFSLSADFTHSVFEGTAYFTSAAFEGLVDFSNSTFVSQAVFGRTLFRGEGSYVGATFMADVTFIGASFTTRANFRSAIFWVSPYFMTVNIAGEATFCDAHFRDGAVFSHSTVDGEADFTSVRFDRLVDFVGTKFGGDAIFSRATFGAGAFFAKATFTNYVRFSGEENTGFRSKFRVGFQHARIERPDHVYFYLTSLRPHWFVNVDARKINFANVLWEKRRVDEEITAASSQVLEAIGDSPYQLLSNTYRDLAVNAEESHRYKEASYFRYMSMDTRWREMNAERLLHLHGLALWKIDWLHWLYGALSGYGERVLQAVLVLFGMLVVFGMLYTRVGFEGEPLTKLRALTVSLSIASLQKPDPKPSTDVARLLITLETILGPVQAALLALAIRRKFMR